MTTPPIVPVILSGGSGTRLWPASRAHQPKQLLPLVGDHSLIGDTIARVLLLDATEAPIIVTNESHAVGIERAMADQGLSNVTLIVEPVGRNTAPAVAAAARAILERLDDAMMLVLPSDHAIADGEAFRDAVRHGATLASRGHLVTFGVHPTAPETGFGYIRAGEAIDDRSFHVDQFVEKPDADTARSYVESGAYSWNSGMFLFAATTYLEELARHRPDIDAAATEAVTAGVHTAGRLILDAGAFDSCPSDSIDYAVMERTDRAAVIPTDPGWSDVGSWTALWDISARDGDGNAFEGDVVAVDTRNSLVHGHDRLVATAGVDGIIVVDTPDAVLVTTLEASQQVKDVVASLNAAGRAETRVSDWEPRPWGTITATSHVPGLHGWIYAIDGGARTDERHAEGSTFVRLIDGSGSLILPTGEVDLEAGRAHPVPPGVGWRILAAGDGVLRVAVVVVDTVVGRNTTNLGSEGGGT